MNARPNADPQDAARRLIEGEEPALADPWPAAAVLELGWAVKDLCYASWSSEPRRAVRAAQSLRRLHDGPAAATLPLPVQQELQGLLDWTEAIAGLIEGEMEAAIVHLDAASAAFAALGRAGPAAQAQVPKIMALAMLGRHEEAVRCAEAAQRALLAHGDLHGASKVSLNLGNLHLRGDRYAAASGHFREASVLFARARDPEHSVMADLGLADALTAFGDFDEALRIYARARARALAHGFPVLQALGEESLALLDLVRGRYREALAGMEGARRRYAELQMPQHLAIAEKQLADAYLELRLLPEALGGYEATIARFRALEMQDDLAWTLQQQGRALALSGQRAAAAAALSESASLFAGSGNASGAAAVELAQAELALAGAATAQALSRAREAARLFAQAGLVERRLRAETVQAQALLQAGDAAPAHALFDATLEAARLHHLLPVQLRCLTGRAMAALAADDRHSARADLEAAVDLFEDQRRLLPGDEVRSAFQNDHLLPFRELLRLDLEAHAAGTVAASLVLVRLDRFRARTLADRLVGGGPGPEPSEKPQDATLDLRSRLAWLYRRLQRLDDEGGDAAALTRELRTTERELLEGARRLRIGRQSALPVNDSADLDVAALQRALAPGDALVEYGVQDEELFACIVTRAQVRVLRRLAAWPEVLSAVQALRFQIETLRHGSAPVQRHLPLLALRAQAHLQRLHALLWQPLAEAIGPSGRLLVVPHEQLGCVPFAALLDGERSIGERLQIAISPSARLAQHALACRPRPAQTGLALGESTRLPNAGREAKAVAGMLPQGQAFVGGEATLTNLRAHGAGADVIHLACHAQFRSDSPQFSALHLADGPLTAEVIETLDLRDSTVVLSGCETALHDGGAGDEMFGLTRAFLVAGAARVMSALWPVHDATTAELMADLYGALRRGQPPAAALRQAQVAARARNPHPFYWASFAITGLW